MAGILLLAGDPVLLGEVLAAPSAAAVDIPICLLDVTEDAQMGKGCADVASPRSCSPATARSPTGCAVTRRIRRTCPTC